MNERLLLDTCAAIYVMAGEPLGQDGLEALETARLAGEPVAISPITAWEIGLLVNRSRLVLRLSPQAWYGALLALEGTREVPLRANTLIASSDLPGDFHRDPADCIIVATARAEGLTVLTRDRRILDYAAAGHVMAQRC